MSRQGFFRFLFQIFLLFLLLELSLRFIFYQRMAKGSLAITEALATVREKIHTTRPTYLYKGYLLARPDSSREVNEEIAKEAFESNRLQYAPWIDFRDADYNGKYINTNGLVRKSVPDSCFNPQAAAEVSIYFLGGSTMYGENATDRETIPSAFVNLYRARYAHGKSIRVVNYGICAFHSYDELILLSHLLYSGHKPSVLIILDGLNDFVLMNAARERLPYYYYRLKAVGKDDIGLRELYSTQDSTLKFLTLQDSSATAIESLGNCLIDQYVSNIKNMENIALAKGVQPFFFIQPNPFYNYPNKKNDPICDNSRSELIERTYPILERQADSIGHCTFLGNLLKYRKGYPFIDRYHYSPSMNKEIASAILDVVGKAINTEKP
jgi:hypothetical protein